MYYNPISRVVMVDCIHALWLLCSALNIFDPSLLDPFVLEAVSLSPTLRGARRLKAPSIPIPTIMLLVPVLRESTARSDSLYIQSSTYHGNIVAIQQRLTHLGLCNTVRRNLTNRQLSTRHCRHTIP